MGTLVLTVIEYELIVDIPTLRAFLAGREPPVHLDKMAALSLRLVSKHPYKVAPSVVTGRFAKMESSFDSSHIEILNADELILVCQAMG